ncbi:thiamin phosphate synthase (thiamin phosphate pyrophosphorylase) [Oleiphilus messinensis]|uniref:Thiamine-phosphate synthase n=1 Tax=Oleiphilus messinensis TaxID=141451 RepID=A0A1Y0IEN2_9GAMM|nr:thiamine phosphate synthase [Oleiphilus messinensis]ARU58730.1 thiamin phosphate synthase (thiamin phosphate pyrophosphorylase) [Oleiphilus messinensis]
MTEHKLKGLYAITDPVLMPTEAKMITGVQQALAGGARVIQYRDKHPQTAEKLKIAKSLKQLCESFSALLLINDDVELANLCNADGVHLGQEDMAINNARAILGPDKIIGATCHDSLQLAEQAQSQGADYLAFGRFFPSETKPGAPAASMAILSQAKRDFTLPIVAIGGITLENASAPLKEGADMLAVVHALFSATDITARASAFSDQFRC